MEKIILVKTKEVKPNPENPRVIKDDKYKKLLKSIKDFPQMLELRPIVVNDEMVVLGGNMRLKACLEAGLEKVPVIKASSLTEDQQNEFIIKDNLAFGEWDWDVLANDWDQELLQDWGLDIPGTDFEHEFTKTPGALATKFLVPPFSVLDTRQGYWQKRKDYWRELIGDMGESRNDTLIASPHMKYPVLYTQTQKERERLGVAFTEYIEKYVSKEELAKHENQVYGKGVSLLDPVLAELIVRWFGIEKGSSFDCFAGDTVFGYVAASLGNKFTGIELRQEQADLNNSRTEGIEARYICDDGRNVTKHIQPESQDLLFSCPPYFDLEVYSDLSNDASNQETYEDFLAILDTAFTGAIKCLKNNRFAVIVITDVRATDGTYYPFTDDIKAIFRREGMPMLNEMILVEAIGSKALRTQRNMKNRKITKVHQNVLVFYKGDTKNIKTIFPEIEVSIEADESTDVQL